MSRDQRSTPAPLLQKQVEKVVAAIGFMKQAQQGRFWRVVVELNHTVIVVIALLSVSASATTTPRSQGQWKLLKDELARGLGSSRR